MGACQEQHPHHAADSKGHRGQEAAIAFVVITLLTVIAFTFWGKIEEERSAYFVGISRAKNKLLLTVCDHRDRPQRATRWASERTAHAEFLGYAEAYA